MRDSIRRVAVVIPARNEQELLPACLESVLVAGAQVGIPVRVIVVLDSCTDDTPGVCRRLRVEKVPVDAGNVGRARAIGVSRALAGETDVRRIWVANTDADSRVTPDWIAAQLSLADEGADAVLGVVGLDGGSAQVRRIHECRYAARLGHDGTHGHVHGANLGVRGSAYLTCGGFPQLAEHEDRQLVLGLERSGALVVRSGQITVLTSARTENRCRGGGFAADLGNLGASNPQSPDGPPSHEGPIRSELSANRGHAPGSARATDAELRRRRQARDPWPDRSAHGSAPAARTPA